MVDVVQPGRRRAGRRVHQAGRRTAERGGRGGGLDQAAADNSGHGSAPQDLDQLCSIGGSGNNLKTAGVVLS